MTNLNNCLDILNDAYLYDENYNIFSISKNRFLLKQYDKKGYIIINLRNNKNESKHYFLHRIVCFINSPIENYQDYYVNHKDGNIQNFNSNNLEWCNAKENVNHYYQQLCTERHYEIWNKEGELILVVDSRKKLSEILNITETLITTSVNKKNKIYGLFICQKKDNYNKEKVLLEYLKISRIPIFYNDKIYKSIRELSRETLFSEARIKRMINKKLCSYYIPQSFNDVQRLSRSWE